MKPPHNFLQFVCVTINPSGLHPDTREKTLDLMAIDEIPELNSVKLNHNTAVLNYEDSHISNISISLINAHHFG